MSAAAATKAANRFIFTTATGAVRRINLNSFNPVKTATGSWHAAKFGRLHFARLRKECLDAGIQDHPFQKAERVIKPVVFKGQKYLIKKQKRYVLSILTFPLPSRNFPDNSTTSDHRMGTTFQ